MSRLTVKTLAVAAMLAAAVCPAEARTINVRGRVVSQGTHEPLEGVTIRNARTERLIGSTNMEGRYSVTVDDGDELLFSLVGTESLTEPVNGRLSIDVALFPKAEELNEIVVIAKGLENAFTIDKAELDVKGNYVYLKKHVKIPHGFFSSGVRMIIQPSIYNVTRRTLTYLKPTVFDGRRYAITQERMLDWDSSRDPLTPFREVKRTGRRTDDVVTIADSLYVDNPRNDFMCMVMTSLENYNRVVYADTFMIARGTVNPLRFLNYSLQAYDLDDERYLPQPEVHLRDTSGDMNLNFAVGKSTLDLALGRNAAEIEALLGEFRTIADDPDMTLKSFTISGTASPEGSYERNRSLADARMNSAMRAILDRVPEGMRRGAAISTEANVATWTDVEDMLRADGLDSEADAVAAIVRAYKGSPDMQSARARRLPFYRMLAEKYLPRLRRVDYRIVSSRYRPLTREEIEALYEGDNSGMSMYNFWSLYREEPDSARRESIMRRALDVHPGFLAAATDLSAQLYNSSRADETVLAPFFADTKTWLRLPETARYDMALAEMSAMHFSRADSLMADLPDTPRFHKGKAYAAALNGRYLDVMQEISEDSPLNEVLLLLAMKDNDTAWKKAQALGDSAIEEYIKATAANRVDEYMYAIAHLENAFRLDPSLREVARVDGDLTDLLDEEESASYNEDEPENTDDNE